MNILYVDIDSLRPDHLGCYGYHRATSPHIDAIAREGLRFTNCYASDAPCLPSRTAMTTGRFGIHTGVVNHGGVAAQPFLTGPRRGFKCDLTDANWVNRFRLGGHHTVAFSPFAQRHGAWHWYAGFMEMHNTGGGGMETADEISPQVTKWLGERDSAAEPFFMWLNLWDPHTPYRTPADFDKSFAEDPIPEWYTEAVRREHWQWSGPHSAQEVNGYTPRPEWMYHSVRSRFPSIPALQPGEIDSPEAARQMFDSYDLGVAYADHHLGIIIQKLKDTGLYDDTAIIISADHGENLGELGVYCDHQTADHHTNRVPMIVRWPGATDARAGESDERLLYAIDGAASSLALAGLDVPDCWDGVSCADAMKSAGVAPHRDRLVISQAAWCVQRSARWDNYLLIQTFHDALHDYPEFMLFDLAADPHEQNDLAAERPDLVDRGKAILHDWRTEQMNSSSQAIDPLETVLAEGGSLHAVTDPAGIETYLERLRATGRAEVADRLATRTKPHA